MSRRSVLALLALVVVPFAVQAHVALPLLAWSNGPVLTYDGQSTRAVYQVRVTHHTEPHHCSESCSVLSACKMASRWQHVCWSVQQLQVGSAHDAVGHLVLGALGEAPVSAPAASIDLGVAPGSATELAVVFLGSKVRAWHGSRHLLRT
jgi:hypothetical protein